METFTTDMNKHKVVVIGCIDPQKLVKKLKKKTGKRVEIIVKKEEEEEEKEKATKENYDNQGNDAGPPFFLDFCEEELLMSFSDENPNACSVM